MVVAPRVGGRESAALFVVGARADQPFGAWVEDGHELGHPTVEDLDYHLTTLFPPVRPRGWLELRFFDALPDPWWRAATTVVSTLLSDDEAGRTAALFSSGTEDLWGEAARFGLAHPALADAARACFDVALGARHDDTVAEFADRFVARRRSPADDRLEEWKAA